MILRDRWIWSLAPNNFKNEFVNSYFHLYGHFFTTEKNSPILLDVDVKNSVKGEKKKKKKIFILKFFNIFNFYINFYIFSFLKKIQVNLQ